MVKVTGVGGLGRGGGRGGVSLWTGGRDGARKLSASASWSWKWQWRRDGRPPTLSVSQPVSQPVSQCPCPVPVRRQPVGPQRPRDGRRGAVAREGVPSTTARRQPVGRTVLGGGGGRTAGRLPAGRKATSWSRRAQTGGGRTGRKEGRKDGRVHRARPPPSQVFHRVTHRLSRPDLKVEESNKFGSGCLPFHLPYFAVLPVFASVATSWSPCTPGERAAGPVGWVVRERPVGDDDGDDDDEVWNGPPHGPRRRRGRPRHLPRRM